MKTHIATFNYHNDHGASTPVYGIIKRITKDHIVFTTGSTYARSHISYLKSFYIQDGFRQFYNIN